VSSPIILAIDPDVHRRAQLLASNLRQVQHEAARFASAATIHALSNHILAARVALHVIAARVGQEKDTEIEEVFECAESALGKARVLLVRTQRVRFSGKTWHRRLLED